MFSWIFIAWLKWIYYQTNTRDSDIEAEAFYPKFQDYWTNVLIAVAGTVIQRQALSVLHLTHALVLLAFCYCVVLVQDYLFIRLRR